jgi:hypothetical protein
MSEILESDSDGDVYMVMPLVELPPGKEPFITYAGIRTHLNQSTSLGPIFTDTYGKAAILTLCLTS